MNQVVLKGKLCKNPIQVEEDNKYHVEILIKIENNIFRCIIYNAKYREYCIHYCFTHNEVCVYAHLNSKFVMDGNKAVNEIQIIVDDVILV